MSTSRRWTSTSRRVDEYFSSADEYFSSSGRVLLVEWMSTSRRVDEYYSSVDEYFSSVDEYYSSVDEYFSSVDEYYSSVDEYYSPDYRAPEAPKTVAGGKRGARSHRRTTSRPISAPAGAADGLTVVRSFSQEMECRGVAARDAATAAGETPAVPG
jgi:hypothetical protein